MAETIAAAGAQSGTPADWARAIANAQTTQDADVIVAAVAQATSEAEFAALAKLFASRPPVIVRTEQLQQFLRVVLPEAALQKALQQALQQGVQPEGQPEVPQAPTPQTPVQPTPTQTPAATPTTTQVPTPNAQVPQPGAQTQPLLILPEGATLQALPAHASQSQTPTAQPQTSAPTQLPTQHPAPTTNFVTPPSTTRTTTRTTTQVTTHATTPTNANTATTTNRAPITNGAMLNADPVITTSSPTPTRFTTAHPAPSSQSLVSNVVDNRAVSPFQSNSAESSKLRATYNAQTSQEIVAPKLNQLLTAQTSTIFATAITGNPEPVAATLVDPQRLVGDHTGENAKAFLMGKEEQPFSVVVFQQSIPQSAVTTRTITTQLEAALNLAILNAFPDEQPPVHAKVAHLSNGMLAVVYEPTQPGETVKAAPLMNNAGYALLAEPARGGDQLAPKFSIGLLAREGVTEPTNNNSTSKTGNNGSAEQNLAASHSQARSQSWSSTFTGWLNAPATGGAQTKIPSALALGAGILLVALFALDANSMGEFAVTAAAIAGIAAAFALWNKRDNEQEPLLTNIAQLRNIVLAPWRMIRPAVKYGISLVKGTGEPWAFFAHERDWTEWSRRARLRMALQQVQQDAHRRVANMFLPPDREAFELLGLPVTAKWSDVNTAFRTLAKRYHPDSAPAASPEMNETLNEEFHKIMSSYVVLRRRFQGK